MILTKKDFNSNTLSLAKSLIGCFLAHETAEGKTIGRIIETEAYLYKGDPACHAHKGQTTRNAPMFGPAGRVYVYTIYGMYQCFNVTSGKQGEGEAVLIRALEPVSGVDLMMKRRGREKISDLCSGPAKLVIAMGIGLSQNSDCLRSGSLRLHSRDSFKRMSPNRESINIISTTRVGISKGVELPYRFLEEKNPLVSRAPRGHQGD